MLILYNATVYTLDEERPTASAIAIERDRIIALGNNDEILAEFSGQQWGNEPVLSINLESHTVIPGLTDAHIHLQQYALNLQKVDCETNSLAECLRRVAARAQNTPPGEWILGHGWNQNEWSLSAPPQEKANFPSAADLDTSTVNHPVFLTAKSLHAGWANSAALRRANITAQTLDPEGGRIQRDEQGNPAGILFENAMGLIYEVLPENDPGQLAQAIRAAQNNLWQMGLTGLHDFDRRDCFNALQFLHSQSDLRLRVVKSIPLEDLHHAVEVGLRSGFGDDFLRTGSIKAFADGALGPRTAAMLQPYEGEPENRGMLLLDAEELYEQGRIAVETGLSLAVHAIGDRANHEVLTALDQLRGYEQNLLAKGDLRSALRHRIEHVQIIHHGDVSRLAELEVIASMQPIHAPSDYPAADRFWGERASGAYAWRTLLAGGTRLAFGSDAPVESPNPFWGLHAAVTRRRHDGTPGPEGWYPAQKLSVAEALSGYTSGAAYAAGLEDRLGKLAPGYYADLLVLGTDPFTCDLDQLKEIHPLATMVGGEWVWSELF